MVRLGRKTQIQKYREDWNLFARDILRVCLDPVQQGVLRSIQINRKTTVRSGHARGKDYVSAVASLCFLYLHYPSKVINTAPTQRQVYDIMMAEIQSIHNFANTYLAEYGINLGGEVLASRIKFQNEPDWFLVGFKAADKAVENWTGYHSENIMVCVTEASGIEDCTFDAIEGLLTGNSRLLIVGNPTRTNGHFFNSFKNGQYKGKFVLSCLDAPNVVSGKNDIPGQVDWVWVNEKVTAPGWTRQIDEKDFNTLRGDFVWENKYYIPGDLFRVKVLGEFPEQAEDSLIPLNWVERSNRRWEALAKRWKPDGDIEYKLGVDVAGMGNDAEVFYPRTGSFVHPPKVFFKRRHTETAGMIKNIINSSNAKKYKRPTAYVDTIGEGAGVYDILEEQHVPCVSVKFSRAARKRHKDKTGERLFLNMRAYCWWAIRDALDPDLDGTLALPPSAETTQDLTEVCFVHTSNGRIKIEPKADIKKRLGRSPDHGDALANTFYPEPQFGLDVKNDQDESQVYADMGYL